MNSKKLAIIDLSRKRVNITQTPEILQKAFHVWIALVASRRYYPTIVTFEFNAISLPALTSITESNCLNLRDTILLPTHIS